MYEITPTQRRSRLPLLVGGLLAVLLLGSCMVVTAGAFVVSSLAPGRTASRSVAGYQNTAAPAVQATPRARVVVQPPPEGVDYETAVLRNIYQQVNPSVVNIAVLAAHPLLEDGRRPLLPGSEDDELMVLGSGSGFVWDREGHIVTNNHVVEDGEQVQVTFSDGTMSVAEVVGADTDSDLAVLRIDPTGYDLVPVQRGNLDDVFVGMRVAAIGNPFGLAGTLTSGIVSAIGRSIPSERGGFSIPGSIQTDAAINPGNSGGPLLNERGEVIGVNAQIRSEERANSGVGFAIPISTVERVVPSLIASGRYVHSYMGVSAVTFSPICAGELGLDPTLRGVVVANVLRNSPAARAGVRSPTRTIDTRYPDICPQATGGDFITAIDGRPVTSFDEVLIYLARYTSPGDAISLTVLRDGATQEVTLKLSERP